MSKITEGHFENGDVWTGAQYDEDGETWYLAIDADGQEYETSEVPTPTPLFTMKRFDGNWTKKDFEDK